MTDSGLRALCCWFADQNVRSMEREEQAEPTCFCDGRDMVGNPFCGTTSGWRHIVLLCLRAVGRFLRQWTLPVAMVLGALAYFLGRELPLSGQFKGVLLHTTELLQPLLLFCMLFVAFCKVSPSQLRPHVWHLWLMIVQSVSFALVCLFLWLVPETPWRSIAESLMLAMVCPTATACAVVTQKLGGDSAATTSYTIAINILVAVLCPLLLPIAHPQAGMSFFPAFLLIMGKVFPLLMLPLLFAWCVRRFLPVFHSRVVATSGLAFYMWAVSLALAIAVSCRALAHSEETLWTVLGIGAVTMIACLFQFAFGKWVGSHYGLRMEAGQAMGQKNTVFIIWLGYTFLSPATAIAGGFYSIWHNVVNSYQLYQRE